MEASTRFQRLAGVRPVNPDPRPPEAEVLTNGMVAHGDSVFTPDGERGTGESGVAWSIVFI